MARRKIIDMPEEQFVGALERQVDMLADKVEGALRDSQPARSTSDLADEAARLLTRPRHPRRKKSGCTPKSR